MNMKRFLALLLTVLLLLSVCPIWAAAAQGLAGAAGAKALDAFAEAYYSMKTEFAGAGPKRAPGVSDPNAADAADGPTRLIVYASALPENAAERAIEAPDGFWVLQYRTAEAAAADLEALRARPGVTSAEPEGTVSACEDFLSWGYGGDHVNANNFNGWLTGQIASLPQIKVAVIDTGVNAGHEFLSGRVLTGEGRDYVNNDDDAEDDNMHGTHVAGTIVDGTLPNVKILPVKVLSSYGSGSETDVYLGIKYAIQKNADVMNLSLSGGGESAMYQEAIDQATAKGIVVCVAAGNNNQNAAYETPSNVESAITVAAVDRDGKRASFSNYGEIVDIAAPGVDIYSAIPLSKAIDGSSRYASLSGTSMATPHVAAAAASLKTYNKNLKTSGVMSMLRAKAKPVVSEEPIGCGALCLTDIVSADASKFSLDTAALTMYPGQTVTVGVTNSTGASVSWATSNAAVVTVANGAVTAVATGSASVTVQAGDQRRVISVTVKALSFTLNRNTAETYPGLRDRIDYTVSHRIPLTWISSDPAVVTANPDGTLVPRAAGTAQLTAVAAEGSASEIRRTVTVTVRAFGAWYPGPGQPSYTLGSARDLYELGLLTRSAESANSFSGATVTVDPALSELDMSAFPEFLPIGGGSVSFGGVFDGSNVPVRNLTVKTGRPGYESQTRKYMGLFGSVSGTVRNVRLENADILGTDYVGGICGALYSGTVENCGAGGRVRAQNGYAGGIAGLLNGGEIVACKNNACVYAVNTCAGGIVGELSNNARVRNCENIGEISTDGHAAGGIAGFSFFGGKIYNCLNAGAVRGEFPAGIVCGATYLGFIAYGFYNDAGSLGGVRPDYASQEACIVNCVNVGEADAGIANTVSGCVVANCFWLSTVSRKGIRDIQKNVAVSAEANEPDLYAFDPALTAEWEGEAFPVTKALSLGAARYNAGNAAKPFAMWEVRENLPALRQGVFETESAYLWFEAQQLGVTVGGSAALPLSSNAEPTGVLYESSAPETVSVSASGVVQGLAEGEAVITARLPGGIPARIRVVSTDVSGWYDPAALSLTISNARELHELAKLTNTGLDDFAGKTVTLTNGFSLAAYENWSPIGSEDAPFRGAFNGADHTLTGLKLTDGSVARFGLFGSLGPGGSIENLRLSDIEIHQTGGNYAAGVCVNVEENATIRNCAVLGGTISYDFRPAASVVFQAEIGWIAARNRGAVVRCANNASSSINELVEFGAIVAYNAGLIDGCVNNGTVASRSRCGGICECNDSTGVVVNCVNNGSVFVATDYDDAPVGGIAALNVGKILNCVNNGSVFGGEAGSAGGVTSPLYDGYRGFSADNVVNEGRVSGGSRRAALGVGPTGKWSNGYWLNTTAEIGLLLPERAQSAENLQAYGADRKLSGGETLLGALNARAQAFNASAHGAFRYAAWRTDAYGRLTPAFVCEHETALELVLVPHDCTVEGKTARVCALCGELLSEPVIEPANGHVWVECGLFSSPTCTEAGSIYFRCANCGRYRTEPTPALGHEDRDGNGWCDNCRAAMPGKTVCRCGEIHNGLFGPLTRFFHNIIYFFKDLFG